MPSSSEITVTLIACAEALSPATSLSSRMQDSPWPSIFSTSARDSASDCSRATRGRFMTISVSVLQARRPRRTALAPLQRGALRSERHALRWRFDSATRRPCRSAAPADASAAVGRDASAAARADRAGSRASGRRRRVRSGVAKLGRSRCLEVALVRAPAHALQAQRADRRDLLRRADLEVAERERVRQPASFEVDEHADAQVVDGGEMWRRCFSHGQARMGRVAARGPGGLSWSSACRGPDLRRRRRRRRCAGMRDNRTLDCALRRNHDARLHLRRHPHPLRPLRRRAVRHPHRRPGGAAAARP